MTQKDISIKYKQFYKEYLDGANSVGLIVSLYFFATHN